METRPTLSATDEEVSRGRVAVEAGLAVLAATVLGVGVLGAAQDDTTLASARMQVVVVGCVAVVAALAAAGVTRRSQKWTAWLLALGLLSALAYSLLDESPSMAAVPLVIALALVLKPIIAREGEPGVDYSTSHTVVSVVSVALMVPIGFIYLVAAVLVPGPAYAVGLILFMVLLSWTIWHARRWSFWAAAGPVLSVTLLFGGLWVAEYFLDGTV